MAKKEPELIRVIIEYSDGSMRQLDGKKIDKKDWSNFGHTLIFLSHILVLAHINTINLLSSNGWEDYDKTA